MQYFDIENFLLMLLEGVYHTLAHLADSPDTDLSLLATGDDPGAITGAGHGRYSVNMGVVDDVHLLARFRMLVYVPC